MLWNFSDRNYKMDNPSYKSEKVKKWKSENNQRASEGVLTRPVGLSTNRGCDGKAGAFWPVSSLNIALCSELSNSDSQS